MGRTGSRRRLASLVRFGTAVVLGGWLLSAGFPLSGQGACVPWSAEGMACYVRVPEGFGRKPDSFQRQPEDPGTGKRYVNPDTGWQVVVEDRANLLEPEQIQELSPKIRIPRNSLPEAITMTGLAQTAAQSL